MYERYCEKGDSSYYFTHVMPVSHVTIISIIHFYILGYYNIIFIELKCRKEYNTVK